MTKPKADYVRSEMRKGDKGHHCHGGMPGCRGTCAPACFACWPCWSKLPKLLQLKIWGAYSPGQEKSKRPSAKYLEVMAEVQRWIANAYPKEKGLIES